MAIHRSIAAASLLMTACASTPSLQAPPPTPAVVAQHPDTLLDSLADRMVQLQTSYDPTSAYFIGVPPPDNRRWSDRSPEGLAAYERSRDELLAELERLSPAGLSPPKRFIHASMVERLQADQQARVCRYELWDVNHLSGWHLDFADVAREQPVETPEQRAQALERWSNLPQVVDQEIANARIGLRSGYSSPKSVVRRVIGQVETIASAKPESLPYHAVAERSADPAFKTAFRAILEGPVKAAFRRYHRFLTDEYLPAAREPIAIPANPNGWA